MNILSDHETTAPDEWLVERMRNARNQLLVESDWAMIADTPTDKTVWATYRQQLRDYMGTVVDPFNPPAWPVPPMK